MYAVTNSDSESDEQAQPLKVNKMTLKKTGQALRAEPSSAESVEKEPSVLEGDVLGLVDPLVDEISSLEGDEDPFVFGLEGDPELFKDLSSLIEDSPSQINLPPQVPSAPRGRVRRRQAAENEKKDQLPARITSNRELLNADELTR